MFLDRDPRQWRGRAPSGIERAFFLQLVQGLPGKTLSLCHGGPEEQQHYRHRRKPADVPGGFRDTCAETRRAPEGLRDISTGQRERGREEHFFGAWWPAFLLLSERRGRERLAMGFLFSSRGTTGAFRSRPAEPATPQRGVAAGRFRVALGAACRRRAKSGVRHSGDQAVGDMKDCAFLLGTQCCPGRAALGSGRRRQGRGDPGRKKWQEGAVFP